MSSSSTLLCCCLIFVTSCPDIITSYSSNVRYVVLSYSPPLSFCLNNISIVGPLSDSLSLLTFSISDSLSLSFSFYLSLSLPISLSLTLSASVSLFACHSLSLSLFLSLFLCPSLSLSISLSLSLSPSLSLSSSLSVSLCLFSLLCLCFLIIQAVITVEGKDGGEAVSTIRRTISLQSIKVVFLALLSLHVQLLIAYFDMTNPCF